MLDMQNYKLQLTQSPSKGSLTLLIKQEGFAQKLAHNIVEVGRDQPRHQAGVGCLGRALKMFAAVHVRQVGVETDTVAVALATVQHQVGRPLDQLVVVDILVRVPRALFVIGHHGHITSYPR